MFTKRMKGHLRLYRGGGNEGTLPEWLRGEGIDETPGYITIPISQFGPRVSQWRAFHALDDFFVLRLSA